MRQAQPVRFQLTQTWSLSHPTTEITWEPKLLALGLGKTQAAGKNFEIAVSHLTKKGQRNLCCFSDWFNFLFFCS